MDIEDDGYFGTAPNTNFTVNLNSFAGDTQFGVGVFDASGYGGNPIGYTGTLNASANWWGTAIGANPSDSTAPTAIDGLINGSGGAVTVGSFLNSGNNSAATGFTHASSTEMWVPKTAATSHLTFVDGNIQDGVNTALLGMTVRVAVDTYLKTVRHALPIRCLLDSSNAVAAKEDRFIRFIRWNGKQLEDHTDDGSHLGNNMILRRHAYAELCLDVPIARMVNVDPPYDREDERSFVSDNHFLVTFSSREPKHVRQSPNIEGNTRLRLKSNSGCQVE